MEKTQREFKNGLGTVKQATERHIERNNGIRKDKRAKALNKIRGIAPMTPNNKKIYQVAKEGYSRLAYLNNDDINSLRTLEQITRLAPDDVLEEIVPELIKPLAPFVSKLVEEILSKVQERAFLAVSVLSELALASTSYQIKILSKLILFQMFFLITKQKDAIFLGKFAVYAVAHFEGKTNLCEKLWALVETLALACKESRDVLLSTEIFVNIVPPMEPGKFKATPFIQAMSLPNNAFVCAIICALFEPSHCSLPPAPFVRVIWDYIVKMLQQIFPDPLKEVDEDNDPRIKWLLSALTSIACYIDNDLLFSKLIFAASANFLRFIVKMIPRVTLQNKLRIMDFLVYASKINLEDISFTKIMIEAGCADIMITLLGNPIAALQRESLLWLSIIAKNNLSFIYYMHENNVFKIVSMIIHNKKTIAIRPALNCLIDCATECLRQPDHNSIRFLNELISNHGLIVHTVELSTEPGCDEITVRILYLWKTMLKWDFRNVKNAIEENGGLEKLASLDHHPNAEIAEALGPVEELMYEREQDMEIEFCEPQLDPATGNFKGGYVF